MRVCLDKSLFSSNKHLVVDLDSYSWEEAPLKCDLFSAGEKDSSLNKFLSLYEIEGISFLEEKYIKMVASLGIRNPDWKNILPSAKYQTYKRNLQEKAKFVKKFIENDHYSYFFSKGNLILNRLEPAAIDIDKLLKFTQQEENNNLKTILKSFQPEANGFAKLVDYDRLKTVTGRLVVKSGPQFLLLPKEYKSIIKSRHGNEGIIAYIDFVSLEPRFAKLSIESKSPDDIYEDIVENNDFDFDRKTMKSLVLATIFGAGVNKLSEIAGQEAFAVQKAISKYFGFNKILEKAGDYNSGTIKNFFGRPIKLKKRVKNVAINNYIQSSSVDVALMGFSKLLLPNSAYPVAVVHDALVVDLLKTDLPKLKSIINRGIEISDLGHFRLGVELL